MAECPNSLQLDHEGRICALETNDKEQDKKIDRLDEIRDAVVGINANLTFQQKEREELNAILTQLTGEFREVKGEVKEIKGTVGDLTIKVDELSKSDKNNYIKIDKRIILKKVFKWIVYVAASLTTIGGFLKLIGVY